MAKQFFQVNDLPNFIIVLNGSSAEFLEGQESGVTVEIIGSEIDFEISKVENKILILEKPVFFQLSGCSSIKISVPPICGDLRLNIPKGSKILVNQIKFNSVEFI